ncbi:MAG TPA: C40 family peptidase [Syntrophorhabdaceae bacterium]|jgi:cell wall-associated NlpC family hydrolase
MKSSILIAAVCAFVLTGTVSYANIYGYQDERGIFHFTNVAPVNKKYRTVVYTGTQYKGSLMAPRPAQLMSGDRKELIGVAKTYLGTPYKLGGNFSTGIDCSGFVKQVFSAFSVSLPRTARQQYHEGTRVDKDDLLAGDLVFFRSEKSADPAHVGIFIDQDRFIHATTRNGGGVRIDSLADNYYRRTFMGASRLLQ